MSRKTPVTERAYTRAEKRERNERLYAMHLAHPQMSLAELGERFDGISKQRVQQIIKQKKEST